MKIMRTLLFSLAFTGLFATSALAQQGAVLQGLDKVTARISTFEAPIDKPVRFGTLRVTVRTCSKTPPEEPPENAAFLVIVHQNCHGEGSFPSQTCTSPLDAFAG